MNWELMAEHGLITREEADVRKAEGLAAVLKAAGDAWAQYKAEHPEEVDQ